MTFRSVLRPLATAGAGVLVAVGLMVAASTVEAAPLTCSGTAEAVVGAGAGSLATRVGVSIECDEPATLQFTLPGGAQSDFATEADGTFTGVVGSAYICNTAPASVAVLGTTDAGDRWTSLIEITQPPQAPAGAPPPGAECDLLLHPEFNYVTYTGALVSPEEAFADERFTAVMPFGENTGLEGSEHVLAVFTVDASGAPTDFGYRQWRPGAPAFVNTLDLLVPGTTYIISTDAELAWVFPEAQ